MPRLSDPRITKAHAISFLLDFYFDEEAFVAQLGEIHLRNLKLLAEWAVGFAKAITKCSETMTADEYLGIVRDIFGSAAAGKGIPDLPANFAPQFEEFSRIVIESGSYFEELEHLAFEWKLRAPWAGPILHYRWLHGFYTYSGLPQTVELSLEQLDLPYPWPPPLPPLEIKVPAWAFVFYSRRDIQAEIAGKLESYEDRLKAMGLRRKPNALQKHARWWFEHFVHRKKYDDIAQEESYTPDGSVISYAVNVGAAVRGFSRLIGIDTKSIRSQ